MDKGSDNVTLFERLDQIDQQGQKFDTKMYRLETLTESVFRQQKIDIDSLNLKALYTERTVDISGVFMESAKKVSKILAKTRQAFEAYNHDIDATINEKIMNDKTNALFEKIGQKLKNNPDMANRKIEVHDMDRELSIINKAIGDTEKMMAKIKASGVSDETREEIDQIHSSCQKERKTVKNVEMNIGAIINSLKVPYKMDSSILSYEKDIEKLSGSDNESDQKKVDMLLKAYLNLVQMAKEVRSVELHCIVERLKKLRKVLSEKTTMESTDIVTEAVVNDKKVARLYSEVSSSIALIKSYIRIAKSLMRNTNLKGVSIAELKGYVKECESVIYDLRAKRQTLKEAVKKAKLGESNLKDKVFGDAEVNSVISSLRESFKNVNALKKKMNKFSRSNRKIVRNIKTRDVEESTALTEEDLNEISVIIEGIL